ncbi:MAG: hypothetical protein A3H69_05525 [Candidatus Sungbacteria bacterium RIFCSPLOWO2_02_FULL_47_9]|uniref:Response regulatory domain-containing protein n=1 Tax=Candidatus Sungbacteria bacterium RIFCSPHIGHO2_01_FULL_47_32 TaxID=1802264 RepID=A0A1G2K6Z7_9BACT|nr:MAG: hypothetical protein A2633_00255 [Candidatus Sungbacteria bacterium RIFCSPHIGHO2_01_FULL_47_32]OGZ98798.1 MAG: hypothetical protein A3D57_04660 [Candidatus Sungbacteria bacterium RIFCSPHIGHO2_02_FULL_46_12]OHA04666.1 MAG: hypothetical protein A3A28_04560 [Candidatus Sungbacteria bacterium RIFCSPLOWO2_01_FULL_47_32]OHA08916.1 MAG: hypothetical protein A3H69_05525 [Candidatus Sungbacteria bacterium RIFCSPLOWO2_02_FULL_47_9]
MEEYPKTEKEHETLEKEYFDLLLSYNNKSQELKKIAPAGAADEESQWLISHADKERNEIHKRLKVVGLKLGKGDMDVMTDILRQKGSLAEYGLPEFFILDANDMKSRSFNVDIDLRKPQKMKFDKDSYNGIEIDPSSVIIPYVISPQWYDSNYTGGYMAPKDFAIREQKARELAKTAHLQVVDVVDYEYFHDSSVCILGVVVPKDRLQEVMNIVRNNPTKYRVGDDFYSDADKEIILASYQKMIEDELEWGGEEHKKEYWEARKELYGEEPPPSPAESQSFSSATLLEKINEELEVVRPASTKLLKKLPEDIEGTEILKDKIIAMIDDDEDAFEAFIPSLSVATGGRALFIPHGGQSIQELAEEIKATNAEIVLLDYHLSMGIDGAEVAKKLIKNGFRGTVIGFSSDKSAGDMFKRVGAFGAIDKNTNNPGAAIKKLAEIASQ